MSEAEVLRLTRERDEAREWVRRLTAQTRVLTCAFCGDEYPPGTPESNDAALLAHVKIWPKHPMREVEKELSLLRALGDSDKRHALEKAIRAITVDAPDGQPNGEAERQLERIAWLMKPSNAPSGKANAAWYQAMCDAFGRLCGAWADDSKRQRVAADAYFGGDFRKPAADGTRTP